MRVIGRKLYGVVFAALVAAVVVTWFVRALRRAEQRPPSITEATFVVRVVRHDAAGLVAKQEVVRDRTRVRAMLAALDVDRLPRVDCPADYSGAGIDLVLSGADSYARRSVYVFDLFADGGATPRAVVSTTAGCSGGPVADPGALARAIAGDG